MILGLNNPVSRMTGNLPLTQHIWNTAWHSQYSTSMSSICAKIACVVFPIIFTVAVAEFIINTATKVWNKSQEQLPIQPLNPTQPNNSRAPQPAVSVQRLTSGSGITTVQLKPGSSQYDIRPTQYDPQNQRPPGCTFHALQAMSIIGADFERCAQQIENRGVDWLSTMQQQIIAQGLKSYRQAVALDSTFQQGADVDHLKTRWPQLLAELHLNFDPMNQDMNSVLIRTQAIINQLFSSPGLQIVWIKSGNDESFALVYCNRRTILFDSHKNEICLMKGQEQTQAFITAKLAPHSQMQDNFDLNAFTYALGRPLAS